MYPSYTLTADIKHCRLTFKKKIGANFSIFSFFFFSKANTLIFDFRTIVKCDIHLHGIRKSKLDIVFPYKKHIAVTLTPQKENKYINTINRKNKQTEN